MSDALLDVFVPGIPRGAGSKRGFAFHRPNGKLGVALADSTGDLGKAWRVALVGVIVDVWTSPPLDMPIEIEAEFIFPRPKSHFGRRRGERYLRDDAPHWHTSAPDTTKLVRAIEDALNGRVWADDRLVARQSAQKRYGERPGARVVVRVASREVVEFAACEEVNHATR